MIKVVFFNFRALHICYPKYLNDELNDVENPFLNLLYIKIFIQFAKSKTLKIDKRKKSETSIKTLYIL